jgi:hypothetical protein
MLVPVYGCKTMEKIVEVEVPTIRTDTMVVYRDRTDSLIVRDSVWVNSGADTIREYRYKYIDRIKTIHDSIYVGRVDTISKTIEVEIERQLTSKEKIAMWIGSRLWWLILLCLLFIVWRIIRR